MNEEERNIRRRIERRVRLGRALTESIDRLPAAGRAPRCPERGTGEPQYHVTVFIDVVDPSTGQSTRVPVYIDTGDRLTASQLINLAVDMVQHTTSVRQAYDLSRTAQPTADRAVIGSVCYG